MSVAGMVRGRKWTRKWTVGFFKRCQSLSENGQIAEIGTFRRNSTATALLSNMWVDYRTLSPRRGEPSMHVVLLLNLPIRPFPRGWLFGF